MKLGFLSLVHPARELRASAGHAKARGGSRRGDG